MSRMLLLIDGSSLLTTQFFGSLPKEILYAKTPEEKEKYYHKIMMTSGGVYTNAVYGFLRTLARILLDQKPSHLDVAWDMTRDTFRRELTSDYKANRQETMKPLKDQFTNSPGIAGASILGDGSVSLIIDVGQLLDLGVKQELLAQAQEQAQYAQ